MSLVSINEGISLEQAAQMTFALHDRAYTTL
jgi:hypothetical protein